MFKHFRQFKWFYFSVLVVLALIGLSQIVWVLRAFDLEWGSLINYALYRDKDLTSIVFLVGTALPISVLAFELVRFYIHSNGLRKKMMDELEEELTEVWNNEIRKQEYKQIELKKQNDYQKKRTERLKRNEPKHVEEIKRLEESLAKKNQKIIELERWRKQVLQSFNKNQMHNLRILLTKEFKELKSRTRRQALQNREAERLELIEREQARILEKEANKSYFKK